MLSKPGFCGVRALLMVVLGLVVLQAPVAQAQTGGGGNAAIICPLGELGCPPEVYGTISASPTVCNIDPATGVCSATISWTASGASQVQVWKRNLVTGSNTSFWSGGSGANSLVANGISTQTLRFELLLDGSPSIGTFASNRPWCSGPARHPCRSFADAADA